MQTAQLLYFCFAAKKCEALVHGAEYSSAPTTCISARREVSCEQKPSSAANCLKAVALTSRREMFRLDFLYRSLCLPARPHAQDSPSTSSTERVPSRRRYRWPQ